jgi:hypothetical protein
MSRFLLSLAMLAVVPSWAWAQTGAPELTSVSPLGGAVGSSFDAVIRGKRIGEGATVWSPRAGVTARTLALEPGEKESDPQLLRIRFELDPEVSPGVYDLRVINAQGLSNPLQLLVHEQPAILEQEAPKDTAVQAQKIGSWPAAVHGRIHEIGQVDFYSFKVEAGQELLFRTFFSAALDPGVSLWELSGSWFDPNRPKRLAFTDEAVAYPDLPTEAVLRYRFDKAGEYLVQVNGFWGYGGEDHVYALLIDAAPDGEVQWPPAGPQPLWKERTWTRSLDPDRMERLAGRTVATKPPAGIAVVDADAEPTSFPVEPPVIQAPTMVVGTIQRPGDIDRVRFSVNEGDRLAFEIETPEKTLPLFNPLLRVLDAEGVEALTNVWTRVNANGNTSKQIYAKTQYAFPRKGDFTLEIRDITASYGDKEMQYKVLVRPWVPHLGEARVSLDRLNLVAGSAQQLSIVIDQEEGFDGLAIFSIDGLPEGVTAVMGAEVDPDSPPAFNEGKKERFTSKSQKATFVLLSGPEAPLTPAPVTARIYAQPAVGGKLGKKILAKELLMMVVADQPADAKSDVLTDTR